MKRRLFESDSGSDAGRKSPMTSAVAKDERARGDVLERYTVSNVNDPSAFGLLCQ